MKLVQRWPIFTAFEEMGYDVASHVCCLNFYNPENSQSLRGHSGLHPLNLTGTVHNVKEFRKVCEQVSFLIGITRPSELILVGAVRPKAAHYHPGPPQIFNYSLATPSPFSKKHVGELVQST